MEQFNSFLPFFLHFKKSPQFTSVVKENALTLFCGEAPEMFGGRTMKPHWTFSLSWWCVLIMAEFSFLVECILSFKAWLSGGKEAFSYCVLLCASNNPVIQCTALFGH